MEEHVAAHYGKTGIDQTIIERIRQAGLDPAALTLRDLASIEEFHIMGRTATRRLAEWAGVSSIDKVLDIGSGIGGPARFLASEFGCSVTGIDLTPGFVRTARLLSDAVGLSEQTEFFGGSALELPFDESSFDLAWLQHVGMNIEDKVKLYGEIRRVLRLGGRFAFHEVLKGDSGPVTYPTPWSVDGTTSFLLTSDETQLRLNEAGFEPVSWQDASEESLAWFKNLLERMRSDGPPALGLDLLVGPEFPQMAANLMNNLQVGSVKVVFAVWKKA